MPCSLSALCFGLHRLLRFDVSSLDCEKEIRSVHHLGGITSVTTSPNGQFLLTGGADQTIKVAITAA